MAEDVHSPELLREALQENSRNLELITTQLQAAKQEQESMFADKHNTAVDVESEISERLADIDGIRSAVAANINALNTNELVYNRVLRPGIPIGIHHWVIDVDNGAGKSTLTVGLLGGNSLNLGVNGIYNVSDTVKLSKAQNSDSNGRMFIDTTAANSITFDATMGGTDQSEDKTLTIELVHR